MLYEIKALHHFELDIEIKEVPKLPRVVPMRHSYKLIDKTGRKTLVGKS